MECYALKIKSIEDNPANVGALLLLDDLISHHLTLTRYLNQVMMDKQLTPPQVYHRAELDRQTYNRLIQYDNPKRASKRTLMQICIGIFATENEANELLATCGYTFASEIEDVAFLFCIRNGYYNMFYVYEAMEIIAKRHTRQNKRVLE